MMNVVLIICSLAVGHSLFSAVALLVIHKKPSNQLLAVLLLLLSIRIGKSVAGYLFPEAIYGLSAAGIVAMASIGPILFFLIQNLFTSPSFKSVYLLHFLPSLIIAVIAPWTGWSFLIPVYQIITAQLLVYIVVCFAYIYRNHENFRADDLKWKWSRNLLTGICFLWITFVLQITVYYPIVYALNVITAAVVFYSLSLWAMMRARIFLPEPKGKPEPTNVYEELGNRILKLLEQDELFIDPNLNITRLAEKLKAPPYLVSRAVNSYFKKSFSELLMHYRIKKSERMLLSAEAKTFTIEAIAYESGFNTLSAFYTAFKKIHKTTPAQFRDGKGLANLKIA
jgi:AraC-like DNA-binding protein